MPLNKSMVLIFWSVMYLFKIDNFPLIDSLNTNQLTFIVEISDHLSNGPFIAGIQSSAITATGDILLLCPSSKVVNVYNKSGKYKKSIGRQGRGPGEFVIPSSVGADHKGHIFVTDIGNAKISIWDNNYEFITDLPTPFPAGWYTQYKSFGKNKDALFVMAFRQIPPSSEYYGLKIFELNSDPWRVDLIYDLNEELSSEFHDFLYGWGSWAITDSQSLFITGNSSDYTIYKLNRNGDLINSFGTPMNPVLRSSEEVEMRIEGARRISEQAASMLAAAPQEKPIFMNIAVDQKGDVWAHRSKEFGAGENFDVYSSSGIFKYTITLPPSKKEYQMMGIYEDQILFRVTNPDGNQSLRVYRIEYGL